MFEFLGKAFIVVGVMFNLLGCLGLVRFPDYYTRLQASTKSVTLGTCGILFGVFLLSGGFTAAGVKALLCLLFLLLTAPVAAHALARAAHKSGVKLWEKTVCDEYKDSR
ncbi:MAG: monovalent cation/H(+) antiporter subunit G [Endomicrobiia bacterium]|nr:monovalent cation/H(+) antiporter subunit G [Endomicrobiia bacterium]